MREILYSPGYGAGWTTWESDPKIRAFMLTYAPIIAFLKSGGSFDRAVCDISYKGTAPNLTKLHPILRQFAEECQSRFGSIPYLGGARDLTIATVSGPVYIDEYDGYESYEEPDSPKEWL